MPEAVRAHLLACPPSPQSKTLKDQIGGLVNAATGESARNRFLAVTFEVGAKSIAESNLGASRKETGIVSPTASAAAAAAGHGQGEVFIVLYYFTVAQGSPDFQVSIKVRAGAGHRGG